MPFCFLLSSPLSSPLLSLFPLPRSTCPPRPQAAKTILENPIQLANFNRRAWMNRATDVIAIERTLSARMKKHFLGTR